MNLSSRTVVRGAFSPLFTAILFTVMACYLIRGKFFGGPLRPETMMLFAGAILLQGGGAFIQRVFAILRPVPQPCLNWRRPAGSALRSDLDSGVIALKRLGFTEAESGAEGMVCLVKGGKRALFLEAASYGGLLLALSFGMVNYGLGLHGHLQVSPHGEPMGFVKNLRVDQKGFLVDLAGFDLKLRCQELTSSGQAGPSQIMLEIVDGKGRVVTTPRMQKGERVDVGRFRVGYNGDAYLLSSYITLKNLDLRSLPAFLHEQWGGRAGAYRGALRLMEPGATGIAELDPATEEFRFVVTLKDGLQGGQHLRMGEAARDGDFFFTVTSYGHFGRVEIWHHYYRNQIFGGLALMLIALLARLILRPQRVLLWSEGGKNFFFTRNGAVRRELAA